MPSPKTPARNAAASSPKTSAGNAAAPSPKTSPVPEAPSSARHARKDISYGPAPESSAFATDWLDDHERVFGHFVNGEWKPGDGALIETRCPADGAALAQFRNGTAADVEDAVSAASRALPAWRGAEPAARARHLYRLARQLQKRQRHFAVLEALDNGKPIRESRDIDVPLAARHFYHHAGWAQLLEDAFPGYHGAGVAGQIIPWNFPLLMLAWKVAPALAAGCTVVLKPAEHTPLTALLFAELTAEAGLPPGVFNVVTGDGATGAALVRHSGVDKIAFTGSTEVGREIRMATAGTGKKLSLELGGKSPFVVFESADLDAATEGVVDSVWFNQGEVCCAGTRLLVQESVEEAFLERVVARMETIRVGHPLDKSVDMGAIVDGSQVERIERYLEIGRRDGAQIRQPATTLPQGGFFVPPTLCTGAPSSSRIVTDEIFGPVVTSLSFRTPAEAVELANDTRYGLAASVWTEDVNVALDIAPAIKAGTVWINCTNMFDAASGFGGYRESGFGREGGREGMWEYLAPVSDSGRAGRGDDARGSAGGDAEADGDASRTSADGGSSRAGASSGDPRAGVPAGLKAAATRAASAADAREGIDRTRKLYVGGKQARPDGGYSLVALDSSGAPWAEVPRGNRKDVRNAVEAARKARDAWRAASGHARAQILYFLGENLAARADEFAACLQRATGMAAQSAAAEVEAAVQAAFTFAAWADKHDGRVHATPMRNVTLAMHEPVGTVGVRCADRTPLAGFVAPLCAAMSQGSVVVAVASARFPVPALDLVQVLETSDVPPGVANVLSGLHDEVFPTLAGHDDVDQLWDLVGDDLSAEAERLSAGNLKRVWADRAGLDWTALSAGDCEFLLRQATRVKNIWVPYGA